MRSLKSISVSLLAPLALWCLCGVSPAAEWSMRSGASESVEYNDNIDLDPNPDGNTYASYTNVDLDLVALSPLSKFALTSDLAYRAYWGSHDDTDNGIEPRARADFSTKSRLTDLDVFVLFAKQNAAATELLDSGLVTADTDRLTFSSGGTVTRKLTETNALSLSGAATRVDFTDDIGTLEAYQDYRTSASLSHRLTMLTDLVTTLGLDWYLPDDEEASESLVYSATIGISSELTRRARLRANVGVQVAHNREDVLIGPGHDFDSSNDVGATGDLAFDYRVRLTQVSVGLSHSFLPSSLGELQRVSSANVTVSHQLSDTSNVDLLARVSHQSGVSSGGSGERDLLVLAPSYAWKFARDWQVRLGYQFAREDEDGDIAKSNSLMMTLHKEFEIAPTRAAK